MTIKQKRSSVAGKVPTTGQLELGELAVNTFDGKLFLKKSDGTEEIVEVGARWGDFTLGLVNTELVFRWNGTELMRLDSSGNLILSGNVTAFGDLS
jgi:hypothetical protein